ncbi:MAG: hypothetical protein LBG96_13875 [Tannerella sp.]|jgi:hypothetical protein|nr:hypothetical protein [Tannerella sp.]
MSEKSYLSNLFCKYYVIVCIAFVSMFAMSSCSNEATLEKQEVNEKAKIEIPEFNLSIDVKDGIVSFDDEVVFKNTVEALKDGLNSAVATRNSSGENTEESSSSGYESRFPDSETMSKYGFYSLYDDFIVAMEEAESYYDREGGYEEFKKKHPALYFPEA